MEKLSPFIVHSPTVRSERRDIRCLCRFTCLIHIDSMAANKREGIPAYANSAWTSEPFASWNWFRFSTNSREQKYWHPEIYTEPLSLLSKLKRTFEAQWWKEHYKVRVYQNRCFWAVYVQMTERTCSLLWRSSKLEHWTGCISINFLLRKGT